MNIRQGSGRGASTHQPTLTCTTADANPTADRRDHLVVSLDVPELEGE